ncbi:MAG: hypothetical protein FRX49_12931 [Trebouxia sp. A1-2]|nr:MAG: hypothetical protein FRX49_12931 [Trebouxia sp. A1-2]
MALRMQPILRGLKGSANHYCQAEAKGEDRVRPAKFPQNHKRAPRRDWWAVIGKKYADRQLLWHSSKSRLENDGRSRGHDMQYRHTLDAAEKEVSQT